ncbi:unnamed protein product [Hydatigera taeniaeformis]|uniref:Uncharacterized protein n=1 Tax=Hydatigena taeniaeformis TaxID=6205 RepID=A0A0R3WPX8_HYDTA|nr:unnamed protein product [Hydatigera taeniaeformis]
MVACGVCVDGLVDIRMVNEVGGEVGVDERVKEDGGRRCSGWATSWQCKCDGWCEKAMPALSTDTFAPARCTTAPFTAASPSCGRFTLVANPVILLWLSEKLESSEVWC